MCVIHCPEAVCPQRWICGKFVRLHSPRLLPRHRNLLKTDKSTRAAAKAVDFRHLVPNMQNSQMNRLIFRRLSMRATAGHNQSLERLGFSMVKGMQSTEANNITCTENLMNRFPPPTLCRSPGRKFGSPITCSSERSGGGPGLRSLALEKL